MGKMHFQFIFPLKPLNKSFMKYLHKEVIYFPSKTAGAYLKLITHKNKNGVLFSDIQKTDTIFLKKPLLCYFFKDSVTYEDIVSDKFLRIFRFS